MSAPGSLPKVSRRRFSTSASSTSVAPKSGTSWASSWMKRTASSIWVVTLSMSSPVTPPENFTSCGSGSASISIWTAAKQPIPTPSIIKVGAPMTKELTSPRQPAPPAISCFVPFFTGASFRVQGDDPCRITPARKFRILSTY